MGAGRAGAATHLVEDHLPILRVPGGQEHLLALLVDLVNAGGQVWGGRAGSVAGLGARARGEGHPQRGSPRMPMSYLPSFLSAAMRWSKVSEKYWKSVFCLCTSSPRMRLRNLLMEQSAGDRGPQAASGQPSLSAHPGGAGPGAWDSPFSTSRQPDRDSRPPMPTDSSPCFMSVGKESLARLPAPPHRGSPSSPMSPWGVWGGSTSSPRKKTASPPG